WFYPAFLDAWFPFPDNRFMLNRLTELRPDYLYISHLHEDHFDHRFLATVNKDIRVLSPNFRSKGVAQRLRRLGFQNLISLEHKQTTEIAPRVSATMFLDMSHKEDSALLLNLGGYRFLDLNDCNTPLSELPRDVDLLAAQYSGAMWYPNCYHYSP